LGFSCCALTKNGMIKKSDNSFRLFILLGLFIKKRIDLV
jgi:hypothetical protein